MNRIVNRTSLALATALTLIGGAGKGDVGQDLAEAMGQGGEMAVIVHFRDHLDLSALPAQGGGQGVELANLIRSLRSQSEQSQGQAIELLQSGGAKRIVQLWAINALATTADGALIQALANLPEVEYITLDATLAAPQPQTASTSLPEWNLNMIGAPELWGAGIDGSGTVIAIMDTGADPYHVDLSTRWRGGGNSWYDPNGEHSTPYDASGHGTQALSLAVGGDGGGSAIGVAPGAEWVAVKIFNDAGYATLSGIHQGFQWLLDPDGNPSTADIPDVVNNSWGFPDLAGTCYSEFDSDLAVLKSAGIAVALSAGNTGSSGSVSPADNPSGFAIGAVDDAMNVASFSSRGPSACQGGVVPEAVAPGVAVRAADLTFGGAFHNSYTSISGTSFAAPHVAGTMALLRQAYPDASVSELEAAITAGAADVAASGFDNDSGYGMVNAGLSLDWLASNISVPSCTDADGDSFFAEAGCGTDADCNDLDATINPLACDIKGDGIDQDCDGVDRLKGKSCPTSGSDGGTGGNGGGGGKGKTK